MAMSEETRKRLNRAIWMERAKMAGIGLGILAAIGAYIVYQSYDLAVVKTPVAGVVETIEPLVAPPAAGTAPSDGLTIGIKLDDGRHVRVIAEKHGGRAWMENSSSGGAIFAIAMPLSSPGAST